MSRQTERAEARHQARVDKANARKPGSYPASRYVPHEVRGKTYPFSSTRQNTRWAA